jgi:hypothetical protein
VQLNTPGATNHLQEATVVTKEPVTSRPEVKPRGMAALTARTP